MRTLVRGGFRFTAPMGREVFMKKQQKRKVVKQFIAAASNYIVGRGIPAEVEGETVKCGVVMGDNGYDVSLRCDPEASRFHCDCVIRNVFPEHKRSAVVSLLTLLTKSQGAVGGSVGVHPTAGDLMWRTYCQARGVAVDAALIHEVITVGVGHFDEMVKQVRELVAGHLP